jgi:Holliday junction resolvase RusA-like endonuclease
MGKPRQTRRDKWMHRDCVVRYRLFADTVRMYAPRDIRWDELGQVNISWTAFFSIPKSYSAKRRAALAGKPHTVKPDRDNVDKALLDALFENDSIVSGGHLQKLWDDGRGARVEMKVETYQ